MSLRTLIFGVGFHGRATCRHLRRSPGHTLVAFLDNQAPPAPAFRLGLPVLPPAQLPLLRYDLIAVPGRNQAAMIAQLTETLQVPPERIWLVDKSQVAPPAAEVAARAQALLTLLRPIVARLAEKRLPFWAMHSGLLGLLRGDELARFSDLDLVCRREDVPAIYTALEDLPGFRVLPSLAAPAQLTFQSADPEDAFEPAVVDFHPFTTAADVVSWHVNGRTLRFPATHFQGDLTAPYHDLSLPLPLAPETLAHALYGPAWRTPAERWDGHYPAASPAA